VQDKFLIIKMRIEETGRVMGLRCIGTCTVHMNVAH